MTRLRSALMVRHPAFVMRFETLPYLVRRQPGRGIVEGFPELAADRLEACLVFLAFALPEAQCVAHGLAGRGIAAALDLAADEAHHLGRDCDADFLCRFHGEPSGGCAKVG